MVQLDVFQMPSKMTNMMLRLKINPNLVGFGFGCKSLNFHMKLPFLRFLVMAAIQDGQQDDNK